MVVSHRNYFMKGKRNLGIQNQYLPINNDSKVIDSEKCYLEYLKTTNLSPNTRKIYPYPLKYSYVYLQEIGIPILF